MSKLHPKTKERKERLIKFREEVLPILQKVYTVTSHGPHNAPDTMYKIEVSSNKVYDYYPMSEKVRININGKYTWSEYPLDKLTAQAKEYYKNRDSIVKNHSIIVNGKDKRNDKV